MAQVFAPIFLLRRERRNTRGGEFNVQKSRGCRGLHASTIAHQHLVAERQTEVGNTSTKMKRT
jgi:hypothetical protein